MALALNVSKNFKLGGKNFQESRAISADAAIVQEELIPAAMAGALTTRTDDNTGVVTVDDSGHGITDAVKVDVYWAAGCRRGMTVTLVTVNAISIDAGSGDNLPAQDTVVQIAVQQDMDLVVTGDNAQGIILAADARSQFSIQDVGGEELFKEVKADQVYSWFSGSGETNPIAGDSIIVAKVSHNDTTEAKTLKIGVAYNN